MQLIDKSRHLLQEYRPSRTRLARLLVTLAKLSLTDVWTSFIPDMMSLLATWDYSKSELCLLGIEYLIEDTTDCNFNTALTVKCREDIIAVVRE